jgi:hypothetical protein
MRHSVEKRNKKPDEISCVQLSEGTKQKLSELGKKGDTFESIILGLIEPKSPGQNMGESQNDE